MGLVEAFNPPDVNGNPPPSPASFAEIVKWLADNRFAPDGTDRARRATIAARLDLYFDRGESHFRRFLKGVYADADVLAARERLIPAAQFQNALRRVSTELATIYQEPAGRKLDDQEPLDAWSSSVNLDAKLRQTDRYLPFVNAVLLFVRVGRVDKIPRLDVLPQSQFSVIADPHNPKEAIGFVIDARVEGPGSEREDAPFFMLWTDTEFALLTKNYQLIPGTFRENTLGIIPAVLVRDEFPDEGILDWHRGKDIVSAHFAVMLLNLLMVHGQVQGTKVPYASGDLSHTGRGQTMDADRITEFEEGVSPGVLDLGHDPGSLIESARSTLNQTAANYGISEDVFHLSTPSSGFDRKLQRASLEQRRRERIPVFRDVERELAAKASIVLTDGADEMFRFEFGDSWAVDFGEVQTPLDPEADLRWRQMGRTMFLRTAVDDIQDMNPDLSEEQAQAEFLRIARDRSMEVTVMRALNMPANPEANGPGQTPKENGALGGAKSPEGEPEDDDEPQGPTLQ